MDYLFFQTSLKDINIKTKKLIIEKICRNAFNYINREVMDIYN